MKEETFIITHDTKDFGPINLYYRKRQYENGLCLIYKVNVTHYLGREIVMDLVEAAVRNPYLTSEGKVACAAIDDIDSYTPILRLHSVPQNEVESFYTNDDKSNYPSVVVKELSRYWDAPKPQY